MTEISYLEQFINKVKETRSGWEKNTIIIK